MPSLARMPAVDQAVDQQHFSELIEKTISSVSSDVEILSVFSGDSNDEGSMDSASIVAAAELALASEANPAKLPTTDHAQKTPSFPLLSTNSDSTGIPPSSSPPSIRSAGTEPPLAPQSQRNHVSISRMPLTLSCSVNDTSNSKLTAFNLRQKTSPGAYIKIGEDPYTCSLTKDDVTKYRCFRYRPAGTFGMEDDIIFWSTYQKAKASNPEGAPYRCPGVMVVNHKTDHRYFAVPHECTLASTSDAKASNTISTPRSRHQSSQPL